MRLLISLLVLFTACCPSPLAGPPGDASSINWKPKPRTFEQEVIDCKGATIGSLQIRKSGVVVRNCKIKGSIRIWGLARNGEGEALKAMSRKGSYVTDLREQSPTQVLIEDTTITGSGTIPLYISPGVTFTTVRNVTIDGRSDSVMVYLDAESHGTLIEKSSINAIYASREAIAIDSSDKNIIRETYIVHRHGGIYAYRNCGQGGNIRHTTPSDNLIERNIFKGGRVAVWLGSREGDRCYCDADEGWPFGSSASDLDHSSRNVVRWNVLGGGSVKQGRSSAQNSIE